MAYIDFYLVPVPRENREAYEKLARISAPILREYGAMRVVECWMDESGPESSSYHAVTARRESDAYAGFAAAAGAKPDESIVLSFAEWPDKATRDLGMQKFTEDPRTQFDDQPYVFEGGRLIAGGFLPMIYEIGEAR